MLVGLVAYLGFVEIVQRKVQGEIKAKLDEFLPPAIKTEIGKASFIDGVGFKIENLRLTTASTATPSSELLDIESAFIQLPVSTPELVTCEVSPTAIKIKQAKIRLERSASGEWNFEPLLSCFQDKQEMNGEVIPVDLINCQLTLVDQFKNQKFSLSEINLHIRSYQAPERRLIRLMGSLRGVAVEEVGFQVFVDPATKTWSSKLTATELRISKDLFRTLPDSVKELVLPTEFLAGTLDLNASAHGRLESEIPSISVDGELRDFTLKHPGLPATLSRTDVDFHIDNQGISVSQAKGLLDASQFNLTYRQRGLLDRESWQLEGAVNHFDFRPKFLPMLPGSFKNFCRDFAPYGVSDMRFQLAHDGRKLHCNLDVDVHDLAVSFIKMPYQLEHCKGQIRWHDDLLNFRLTTNDRGQEIVMSGSVLNPGKRATFKMDIDLSGSLPIDEKLLRAVRKMPNLREAVHDFRPSGRISGHAVITRTQPDQKPQQEIKIRLVQCNVRHKAFEYPIYNINGNVHFRAGKTYFQQVTGESGVARVEANGSFSESQGIDVNFLCNQVPLNEQLRLAIPANIRDIWNGFRPEGVVDILRVNLSKPPREKMAVTVAADLGSKNATGHLQGSSVAIFPKWFPYSIRNLSGKVFVGNGEIRLSQMKGKHDRTYMIWNGSGTYSPKSWSLLLQKMHVGAVKVNEELLAALPKSLAPAIRQLQYQGALSVDGDIHLDGRVIEKNKSEIGLISYESFYEGETREPSSSHVTDQFWNTSLAWDLRFDMDQAKMMLGLPVENVFGQVNLQGRYNGKKAVCRGQLAVDSLTLYDAQITQVSGPIWMDEKQILAGNYVTTEQSDRPPTPLSGKLFEGTLRLDAKKILNQSGDYFVQTSLAQGKLEEAVLEYAPQLEQVRGGRVCCLAVSRQQFGTSQLQGKRHASTEER